MRTTAGFPAPGKFPVTDDDLLAADLTAALRQDRLTAEEPLLPAVDARVALRDSLLAAPEACNGSAERKPPSARRGAGAEG